MRIFLFLLFNLSFLFSYAQVQIGGDIDGEAANDQSGESVAISANGTRVAIGAYNNDGTESNAGHVRIYEENGGIWTQLGSDIDGEAGFDLSGWSVSLSSDGTRVAIGATLNNGTTNDVGHVRIYEENGGIWTQLGNDIDGETIGDRSGNSVSLSSDGTRVAIGAITNDGTASDAGHVRIYEESGGNWTQLGGDIDGEAANDLSGWSVSLSSDGTKVAIGARNNGGTTGNNVGHVRIYEESGGVWMQLGSDIDGEAGDDQSGWSVSLSADGARVAIGAPRNDGTGSDAGHVRIYEESGGNWTQLGSDIDGEAASDQSGWSVSLSSDGTRVAIGAPLNNGIFTGDAGHVRIYEENGGMWTQLGSDIDGEFVGTQSGIFTSLSADGTRVAIGAHFNDAAGNQAGHVRVYGGSPLPVELISFEGKYSNNQVLLNWSTASEQNNAGFEIQKSDHGRTWEKVDFVAGKGTSDLLNQYAYIDSKPFSNVNYYRLKQVDHDGRFEYSNIIAIKINTSTSSFQIFPNPSNGIVNLEIDNPLNQKMQVSIMDNLGRIVWKSSKIERTLSWSKEMVLEKNGVYVVSIQIGSEMFFERVVVAGK